MTIPDPTPEETQELRLRVRQHSWRDKGKGLQMEVFKFMGGPLDGIDIELKEVGKVKGREHEASIQFGLQRARGAVNVRYQYEGEHVWRYTGVEDPHTKMGFSR